MRTTTIVLNSIVVVFFAGFLTYTFAARSHLDALARNFVTEKTIHYSRPIVEVADDALKTPLARKLLSKEQTTTLRNEITDYQNNPQSYISDLTRQEAHNVPPPNANPLLEKVASFKAKIRTFYENTLNALITDLRIFSASNLIAGLIALGLAYRSSAEIRKPQVWFSFLMLVATLYCSSIYINDLTFFRILFQAHMGWWYAVFLGLVTTGLFLDCGRHANRTPQAPGVVTREAAPAKI